jgi:hypothetical protein
MTELKETATCPVCGELHEVLRLRFNGCSQIVIPCPHVPIDKPIFVPSPKTSERRSVMSQRFSYVRYDSIRAAKQQKFKELFEAVEGYSETLPDGRAKSLLLTALEEAYMWTGKAIRDEQIAVDGGVAEEKHRGEEGVNVEPKA